MSNNTRNVFISHIHEDDASLGAITDLLSAAGYKIKDGSINSENPNNATNTEYIKREILAPRINEASIMLVAISALTHQSTWVDWEIEYAAKQGIRIVGVWLQGAQESNLPKSLEDYADAIVGWQSGRVIDAIEGRINNHTTPDGDEPEEREIPRFNC